MKAKSIGWACAGGLLALLSLSVPLRCFARAALVLAGAGADGALCGSAAAMITRTRSTTAIYGLLALAIATLWPLCIGWPGAGRADVHPWSGAPAIAWNYFDALRICAYALAAPYPFARIGQHGADNVPESPNPPPV